MKELLWHWTKAYRQRAGTWNCINTQNGPKGRMGNETCRKMCASLRQEDMQRFFREWMKQKKPTEYVAHNVAGISTQTVGSSGE